MSRGNRAVARGRRIQRPKSLRLADERAYRRVMELYSVNENREIVR